MILKPCNMLREFTDPFRRVFHCVKNLIVWAPVIWKDRDWDFNYIYLVLRFKLVRMEKFIREQGIHDCAPKDAKKIRNCINLIDRIVKDDYCKKEFDRYMSDDERFDCGDIYMKAEELRKKDIAMLFTIMKYHIEEWWD